VTPTSSVSSELENIRSYYFWLSCDLNRPIQYAVAGPQAFLKRRSNKLS